MNLLKLFPLILFLISKSAFSAGFHEASFDIMTAGTVYFGVAPVFASSSYDSTVSSSYTGWGYQATAGYDHSFNEMFGLRGYGSYAHTVGNNTANTDTIYETQTSSDIELGGMITFNGWAVGGGIIPRSSTVEYVNGSTSISKDYSGMLKFAKASLDFTSKSGTVGFSVSESYIFGNMGESSEIKVVEWKSLLNIFYLLNLK